jgi:hypothetical protein
LWDVKIYIISMKNVDILPKKQTYLQYFRMSGCRECLSLKEREPVPVAARSKALVYGRSPAEIVGSNLTGGMDVCLLWVLGVIR